MTFFQRRRGILLTVLLGLLSVSPQLSGLVLVEGGQARCSIVIPQKALSVERYAAQELQYILKKSSGVTVPIVSKSQDLSGSRILLGRAAGLSLTGLPNGSYRIKTDADALRLSGVDTTGNITSIRTAAGTLYAVYRWAEEQLGVLWLWPHETGEVIPRQSQIESGQHDLTHRQRLRFAHVRYLSAPWLRRMIRADNSGSIGYAGASSGGHAFIDWQQRYGKEHPDYFALGKDGRRMARGKYTPMCVSNPAFHRQIVANWQAAGRPDLAVNVKENDTPGLCQCARCLSWDTNRDRRWKPSNYAERNVSDRYARYFKTVWELASKINPEAKVGAYAYLNYVYAPEHVKLNPHIMIAIVDDLPFPRTPEYQRQVNETFRGWSRTGATISMRPNYFLDGYVMPTIWYHQYAEEFKLGMECGIVGIDIDGPNNSWATLGPNLYVMTRLIAKPDADVNALIDEYCSAFGKGAPAVRQYVDYWERYTMSRAAVMNKIYETKTSCGYFYFGWDDPVLAHLLFPLEAYEPADAFLREAEALTRGDEMASYRVRFLRQGYEHAKLCTEASAVFANPGSTESDCLAVFAKVNRYRSSLLPCVADIRYFETGSPVHNANRMEGKYWVFMSPFDQQSSQRLPEHWSCSLTSAAEGMTSGFWRKDFKPAGWRSLSTWHFLEDQGIRDYRHCWYRTEFTVPETERGKRIVAHLGAIDENGITWVNGQKVGEIRYDEKKNPQSWREPQEYDITDLIVWGKPNSLCVLVENLNGKGGLWKPSYIRYEHYGTGEVFKVTGLTGQPAFFSQRQEQSQPVFRITGHPERGQGNAWQTAHVRLPFKVKAKDRFRLNVTLRTVHLREGDFQVVIRQVMGQNETVNYEGLVMRHNNPQWKTFSREVEIQPETTKLYVYLIGRHLQRGSFGEVKDVSVERLETR